MGDNRFNTPAQQARLNAVSALLQQNVYTGVDAVAQLLGVDNPSALPYLQELRECGLAHRREPSRRWSAGPSAAWLAAQERESGLPHVIQSYANRTVAGKARRDPLVEALFGPATPVL